MAKIDEHVKVMMLKGETGSNIKSISKTATSGLVDTYTVTLTDGKKSNFTVKNGRDGKDGADFNTFKIGGRNLTRNSAKLDVKPDKGNLCAGVYGKATVKDRGNGFAEASATDKFQGVGMYANSLGLNPGDILMFSATCEPHGCDAEVYFYAEARNATGERVYQMLRIGSSLADSQKLAIVKDGDSKRLSAMFEWTDEAKSIIDGGGSIQLTIQVGDGITPGSGKSVSIYAPKLERSTKPSDWTPAPEDKADVSVIVPKASVESSATASQAYEAGDYVVVNGILRKVKSAIAKGNAISDSNSTATTVTGELATLENYVCQSAYFLLYHDGNGGKIVFYARGGIATITVISIGGIGVGRPFEPSEGIPERFRPDAEFYSPLIHRKGHEVGKICVPGKTSNSSRVGIYPAVDTSEPSTAENTLYGTVSWIYTEPDDLEAE